MKRGRCAEGFIVAVLGVAGLLGVATPVNGQSAATQPVGAPGSCVVDGLGGLFVVSESHNRIYYVAADGTLSVRVGIGSGGFSGDGGPAVSAQLNSPTRAALDSAGNLYIADSGNHRIRKVTPDGIIATIAGDGTPASGGDGGPAVSAELNYPESVAIDSSGNLFITEFIGSRIRKVDPSGTITSIAGTGTQGFNGDGIAITAQLNFPEGIVVDAGGNLFFADVTNNRIRKITPEGIISTVAGTGALGFGGDGGRATSAILNLPHAVAFDTAGDLFISDTYNRRIRKVTPNGTIRTVAGNGVYGFSGDGGSAVSAELSAPLGIAVDQ